MAKRFQFLTPAQIRRRDSLTKKFNAQIEKATKALDEAYCISTHLDSERPMGTYRWQRPGKDGATRSVNVRNRRVK